MGESIWISNVSPGGIQIYCPQLDSGRRILRDPDSFLAVWIRNLRQGDHTERYRLGLPNQECPSFRQQGWPCRDWHVYGNRSPFTGALKQKGEVSLKIAKGRKFELGRIWRPPTPGRPPAATRSISKTQAGRKTGSAYSGAWRSPFRGDGDRDSEVMPIGIPS